MKLIEIFNSKGYNTDKKCAQHNYIEDYYEEAFSPYQNKNINFLEIGVLGGESMKLWADYFTNPKNIVGIDIFVRISKSQVEWNLNGYDVKLHTLNSHGRDGFHGEYPQSDNDKFEKFVETYGGFDIIIEDGHHDVESQIKTYERFGKLVNSGGLYVVEDITNEPKNIERIKEGIPDIKILESSGTSNQIATFGVIK